MSTHLPIPEHWTPEQVVSILDLLEELYHAIRDSYHEELRELVNNAQLPLPFDDDALPDPDFDDDIRF